MSGRRNSNGSRSVRSRSSRQEFWGPADITQRPLQTFEEQSVASDSDSDADEDYENAARTAQGLAYALRDIRGSCERETKYGLLRLRLPHS